MWPSSMSSHQILHINAEISSVPTVVFVGITPLSSPEAEGVTDTLGGSSEGVLQQVFVQMYFSISITNASLTQYKEVPPVFVYISGNLLRF